MAKVKLMHASYHHTDQTTLQLSATTPGDLRHALVLPADPGQEFAGGFGLVTTGLPHVFFSCLAHASLCALAWLPCPWHVLVPAHRLDADPTYEVCI